VLGREEIRCRRERERDYFAGTISSTFRIGLCCTARPRPHWSGLLLSGVVFDVWTPTSSLLTPYCSFERRVPPTRSFVRASPPQSPGQLQEADKRHNSGQHHRPPCGDAGAFVVLRRPPRGPGPLFLKHLSEEHITQEVCPIETLPAFSFRQRLNSDLQRSRPSSHSMRRSFAHREVK